MSKVEFGSPIGRLVQGSFALQERKDDNNQVKIDPTTGKPEMGVFFAMAFAKNQPDWPQFEATIKAAAAAAWPQFFPQGPHGPCVHPAFSMKIIDGDGVDNKGKPNNQKPGFAGHWVVKFSSKYEPKVHIDGKFQPHEVLTNPDEVFKRGFYGRVIGVMQSNGATGNQKPGIAIFANLVIFHAQGEVIQTGINAAEAAAKYAAPTYVPPGATGAPLGHPGALPPTTGAAAAPVVMPAVAVAQPVQPMAPIQPLVPMAPVTPQLSPAFMAAYPGMTYETLKAQGHTDDAMRANGWIV